MRAFIVSLKIFLFLCVFTLVGVALYALFPAFHSDIAHPGVVTDADARTQGAIIVLDAGHGGMDGGAVGTDGTLEKDLNLSLTKDIAQILQYGGFRVILTREDDTMLGDGAGGKKKQADLNERLRIAQRGEDNILVSIHMNKYPDARCRGLQVYYSPANPVSERLAQGVQDAARATVTPDNKRKIKPATSAIFLLHRATVPAILVECGFLSNPDDLAKLKDTEYQKELAAVIAAAIMDGIINERT